MPEKEPLTAGARADANFVARMKTEHPELIALIQEGCLGCSAAWDRTLNGQADRVAKCLGLSMETTRLEEPDGPEDLGQFALKLCHLPHGRES